MDIYAAELSVYLAYPLYFVNYNVFKKLKYLLTIINYFRQE